VSQLWGDGKVLPPAVAARLAADEASRRVGHTISCGGCGQTVVRIIAAGERLAFGEAAYHHRGSGTCLGRAREGRT
jgi:hypothetical protein